ncbi:MAG: hypothetical protein WA580_04750 [Acidimicrobiales bacterium]
MKRVGKVWAIDVPDVRGTTIHTQAHALGDVVETVADAVSLIAGIPPSKVQITMDIALSPRVRAHIANVARLRARADEAQSKAGLEARAAARELKETGLPLRDIGEVLGVSYQRAHQLVKG